MRACTVALLTLSLAALPVHAQTTASQPRVPVRHGFWIGFGAGVGSNLDSAAAGARGGVAANLRLGGSVTQKVLLGVDLTAWARSQNGTTVSRGNAVGAVYFYPSPTGGLFFKGGAGAATASVATSVTVGNTTTTSTSTDGGFGTTLGAGYDIQVGSNFFITPGADLLVQTINSHTSSLLLLTVDVVWH
jgi:hypothetical protein